MPIIFNWEHGGPGFSPMLIRPLGGEASFREFMAKAKARGWHPMIYGDGLCWVTWQKNTNYDGMPYFHAHGGEAPWRANGTALSSKTSAVGERITWPAWGPRKDARWSWI